MTNEAETASGAAPAAEALAALGQVEETDESTWNAEEFDRLLAEANALALYVARHGDSLSVENKGLYVSLLDAISTAESSRSPPQWHALMKAYADVTAVTYMDRGVNGRTILDTQSKKPSSAGRWRFVPRVRPMVIGIVLFVLVLVLEVLMDWSARVSDPGTLSVFSGGAFALITTLSTFLVSAAWGGIGACVFLAKRISDKLFEMAYEESRMRGDLTRVFLGAMLGVVVVVLFFPSFGEEALLGESGWAPGMTAFIAGLGVKPVYAAFESRSEELARRFKGSAEGNTK